WDVPVRVSRDCTGRRMADQGKMESGGGASGAAVSSFRVALLAVTFEIGNVAPHAGARVETWILMNGRGSSAPVAPPPGARIETTFSRLARKNPTKSLPTRERGSKLQVSGYPTLSEWSLPTRERGSKLQVSGYPTLSEWSLPTRERGSKHDMNDH